MSNHSSVNGHFGCFQLWGIINNAAIITCVQVFAWKYVFISLEHIPWRGSAGSKVNMFDILRNCQTTFQKLFCIFYSHHPSMKILIPQQSRWCSSMIIILVDVKSYLIVVLNCVTLMTNGVEFPFMDLLTICVSSLEKSLLAHCYF